MSNPFQRPVNDTPKDLFGGLSHSRASRVDQEATDLAARRDELVAQRKALDEKLRLLSDVERRVTNDPTIFQPRRMPRLWRQALSGLAKDGEAGITQAEHGASADLYWVSADMAHLSTNAAAALPEVHLGTDLWPSDVGFMVFNEPIAVSGFQHTRYVERSTEMIRAVLWAPEREGVTISMFSDVASALTMAYRSAQSPVTKTEMLHEVAEFTNIFGPLMPVARSHYPIGKPIGVDGTGPEPHLAILVSTIWLLMQQPLVVENTKHEVDTKEKKRMSRAGRVPEVRLIDLRRVRGQGSASTGTRNYEHQWMVRGHWRKQWLPSLGIHRPTWVRPHIKGPEGKPMMTGEKVHVWRR